VHPSPAPVPLVATIAISTPSKIAAVLTAFIRLASHVRPNPLHFVSQLSPAASAFTQLTSDTHGGVEAMSRVKPLPQTQAEALVAPPTPDATDEPHEVQTGVAAALFQNPTAQMHAEATVDPTGLDASAAPQETHTEVEASHHVPEPQSEACTGHTVAAFSPLARQQQRRVA
jgi:hypothetical protein